ncbi:rhodopsin-like, partial [Convolutriloba macropyga]|uniref:rhodopsin-like n=1 Tax=Convolutriloba macropyga TaxID=536237 RepID=UPI003F5212C5
MNSSITSSENWTTEEVEIDLNENRWQEVFYAPLPNWIHTAIGFLLVIFIYVGAHGNIATIQIFLSTKSLRKPHNMFLVNLAVVDLIMVIACQPEFCIASFLTYYPFDNCHVLGSMATFGGLCSINSMAMIAYDRYTIICSPPNKRRTPTYQRSITIIAAVWAYTFVFAILPTFGCGRFMLN